jgi:two-component system phosphate regulon sensor histidine kinase PhoR
MKFNKTYLYITISSIALVVVLLIQINWILQTAKIKEEIFNDKANMVLSRTTEELCKDQAICNRISSCVDVDENNRVKAILDNTDVAKIDSLFNKYMKYYNLQLECKFLIEQYDSTLNPSKKVFMSNTFYKPLEEATNIQGLKLKLIIPDKRQFILAEMGGMFITSVVLILVVLAMFWRTILSLLKEKKLAEQTTEFLNNMTHEFKTPLANISLASKLMQKEQSKFENTKLQNYSEIIISENEKLASQVEQLLGMTALERGDIPLHKQELNVHELILDVVKCMNIQIENRNGKIALQLNAANPMLWADKNHLQNAVSNLIDNAIKYSSNEVNIHIETYLLDNNLVLLIQDHGIGMEKEHQQKIFDKYYRVPTGNIHNVKGFGLGLAYVKKILELHHASIELKSKIGQGSSFIIKFKND